MKGGSGGFRGRLFCDTKYPTFQMEYRLQGGDHKFVHILLQLGAIPGTVTGKIARDAVIT